MPNNTVIYPQQTELSHFLLKGHITKQLNTENSCTSLIISAHLIKTSCSSYLFNFLKWIIRVAVISLEKRNHQLF